MNAEQKFNRGDVVRITDDLGPSMSHFRSAADAIVMGSYHDQYGGENTKDYTLMFCDDGSQVSWYHESQLDFIRYGGQKEIDAVLDEKDRREAQETDLPWIVANWSAMKQNGKFPGATVAELMRLIGIKNPWGSNGEGMTYYANAHATINALGEALDTGDINRVEFEIQAVKKRFFGND